MRLVSRGCLRPQVVRRGQLESWCDQDTVITKSGSMARRLQEQDTRSYSREPRLDLSQNLSLDSLQRPARISIVSKKNQ